jgi:hypothetical protein
MEIFKEMPTYSVAFSADICLFLPSGPPRKEEIDGLIEAISTLRKRRGQRPVALFLVVPSDAASPQGADYAVAKAGFQLLAKDLVVSSWVMEGTGFMAAAKRGLTAFLTSSLLGHVPTKVFGHVHEGARWLQQQSKQFQFECPEASELSGEVRELYDRMQFRQLRSKNA